MKYFAYIYADFRDVRAGWINPRFYLIGALRNSFILPKGSFNIVLEHGKGFTYVEAVKRRLDRLKEYALRNLSEYIMLLDADVILYEGIDNWVIANKKEVGLAIYQDDFYTCKDKEDNENYRIMNTFGKVPRYHILAGFSCLLGSDWVRVIDDMKNYAFNPQSKSKGTAIDEYVISKFISKNADKVALFHFKDKGIPLFYSFGSSRGRSAIVKRYEECENVKGLFKKGYREIVNAMKDRQIVKGVNIKI